MLRKVRGSHEREDTDRERERTLVPKELRPQSGPPGTLTHSGPTRPTRAAPEAATTASGSRSLGASFKGALHSDAMKYGLPGLNVTTRHTSGNEKRTN